MYRILPENDEFGNEINSECCRHRDQTSKAMKSGEREEERK